MKTAPPAQIAPQLTAVSAVLERHLAGRLQALHLFGSAIDGGLQPRSDIDLLATVDAPLPDAVRGALMRELLTVSAWPGSQPASRALEVTVLVLGDVKPWRYPPRRELQFGEWLRADLLQGLIEAPQPDPDLAILLTQIRQHSLPLRGPSAEHLFDPVPPADFRRALVQTLQWWHQPADWLGDERNVVLTLARLWFSATTGGIASKDAAATWALVRLPEIHRPVLRIARDAYLGQSQEDLAQPQHAAAVTAFVQHLKVEVERAA